MLHLQVRELPAELLAALETLSRAVKSFQEGEELFRAYYVARESHVSAQIMGRSAGNILAATRAGALVREAIVRNRDSTCMNVNAPPPTGELPHPITLLSSTNTSTEEETENDS